MKRRIKSSVLGEYARMWPRDVFYRDTPKAKKQGPVQGKTKTREPRLLYRTIELLKKPGVCILYRDDVPYYIGQAKKLRLRLANHARVPDSRYYNFWNYFSAFVVEDQNDRNEIERILIAAMPTANSAVPRIRRENLPAAVRKMVHEIKASQANPAR